MRRTLGLLALMGALLPGCSDKAGGGGGGGNTDVAAAQAASGGGQSGEAGSALANPIVIYGTDGEGDGKAGVVAQATVTSGSVSPASGTTDATGHVSFTWTLGTINGTQTLRIHVTGLSNPVTVTATATAPALILAAESGNNQTAIVGHTLTQPVVLRVTQQHGGAGVAAVPLTLAVTGGGGNLDHTSVTTGSDGRATVHWTLGPTVGAQTFTVNGPGLTAVTLNGTGTAEPVQLAIDSGGGQSGEAGTTLPQAIVARVTRQSDGGPAAGVTVSFAVATGGGSVSAASAVTDANGRARVTWTLGAAEGAQTLTVTAPGANPQIVTATATPEARALTLVSGNDQAGPMNAALAQPIVVKVIRQRDSAAVAGVPVAFTVTQGGGSVDQASVTSGADGTVRVTWTLGGTVGAQTLLATSAGLDTITVSATAGNFLRDIVQISAGELSVCAVDSHGDMYCWGLFEIPSHIRFTPTGIARLGGNPWVQAATGWDTKCGRDISGGATCQGKNRFGQVGDGSGVDRGTMVAVIPVDGENWVQPAAGALYNCGLSAGGVASCWGANAFGELGDGTTTHRLAPTRVQGGLTFTALFAGSSAEAFSTCGLIAGGQAFCWGVNDRGELGDGTSGTDRDVPTAVIGGHNFSTLARGSYHTCGLLLTGGSALCRGSNTEGKLGDGTTTDRLAPTMVAGGLAFVEISAGNASTCGLTAAGDVYCWGSNSDGQLGIGQTQIGESDVPVKVIGGHTFAHISSGDDFNCGTTTIGLVYCWGDNDEGTLGNLSTTPSSVPSLVFAPYLLRQGAPAVRAASTDSHRRTDRRLRREPRLDDR